MEKKRELWIDILRGFAIFLVILGHSYNSNNWYFLLTGPVKMPLFYLLSGYVAKTALPFCDYVKKSAYRLVFPWLIFSLFPLYVLKCTLLRDFEGLVQYLIAFFTGKKEWFILSFFISQMLFYFIQRVAKGNRIIQLFIGAACFAAGLTVLHSADIFCINTALTGVFYMAWGVVLREEGNSTKILGNKKNTAVCGAIYALLIIVSAVSYPGKSMDFHNVSYYNVAICVVLSAAGISVLIALVKKVQNKKALYPIAILGKHTIVVYLINSIAIHRLQNLLGRITVYNKTFVASIIISVLVAAIGTAVSVICGKYFPWMVGMKRTKK